jgi:hypothetical protein
MSWRYSCAAGTSGIWILDQVIKMTGQTGSEDGLNWPPQTRPGAPGNGG